MNKIFFVLVFVGLLNSAQAQWCGRPCEERYYNPNWSINDQWYYGYMEMNEYPYTYPVNYYFNYCPCPNCKRDADQRYFRWCVECNRYHQ